MIGKTLGHYEIVSELGKGGMGEVYRARDTKLGREVAIKVLPSEFAQDHERLARLEREARMLAALNHPNIAAIYGLEQSDDTRSLVLELVEGDTLADRLKRGAIPVEEALKLALQIAEALEAAHDKGVIHRDLKPANIKITPEGRVKVLDFGLAKAFIGDQADVNLSHSPTLSMAATQAGIILGTAAYMSPEQATGEIADHRSDVWSFGVVLFEMLAGRQPFTGKTASHVIGAVLERTPEWTQLPPGLHPRIRFLLERCLEKEPKDRCHTIDEARSAIAKALADPLATSRGGTGVSAPASPPSVVVWAAAAAVGAALLAGGAAWILKPTDQGPVRRFSQSWPTDQSPRNAGRSIFALSGDGSSFVYNTTNGLYLRSLDELVPRLIPDTDLALTNPFYSPDGQWIGFWSGLDLELQKITVNGGAPIPITGATNPFGATCGDDDTIVFGQPEGIMRVSANGGEAVLIVEAGEDLLSSPQMLPGGEWVLFTVRSPATGDWNDGSIVAQSLDTGERRVLVEGGTDGRYVSTGHLVYAFGDALWAVPFDLGSVSVTPGGVRLADGLAVAAGTGAANYGISDDGTLVQLYLQTALQPVVQQTNLVYADRDGGIEPIELPPGTYRHARVSPDGRRLTFETDSQAGSDIWIHDLAAGTEPKQLTQAGNNSRPIWTPDGQDVTFMSTREGTPGIWWQRADGSEAAVRLTDSDGAEQWPEAWSPDGSTLMFTRFGGVGAQSIFVVTPGDGGDPIEYVEGQAGAAVFSPDGKWIAYRAARNPADPLETQIFLKPFPEPGPEQQVTQNGGASPLFSPDGTELIYRRASASTGGPAENEIIIKDISIQGGGVTSRTERTLPLRGIPAIAGYRDFDAMPAGNRLVLMLPASPAAESGQDGPGLEFRIVLNWFSELRERVPVP